VTEVRNQPRNLVLIGFMGCGKSAIGRALSRRLNGKHVDTDQEIELLCGKKIPEIFSDEGEDAFRAAEQKVVRKLTYTAARRRIGGQFRPLVVSTGGGTPLRPENADMLRRVGDIVWLTASTDTIVKRVTRNIDQRPLLAGHRDDPAARIESLVAERAPRYAALAAHTFDTSRFASPDEAAQHIITKLNL
jgi:shikimate kinase